MNGDRSQCFMITSFTPYPNNLITDNIYGLTVESNSTVWAGSDYNGIGMNNSIHDNTNLGFRLFYK